MKGRRQAGLGLLELFIAMVLGLLVVGGLLLALMGSGISNRQLRALAEMTQDAQVALNLVARDLQMAGYAEPLSVVGQVVTPVKVFRPVFGCDHGFTDPGADFAAATCSPAPPAATASAANAAASAPSHALEVSYQLPKETALLTQGQGALPVDCKGAGVDQAAGTPAHLVSNRYFVKPGSGASGGPALACASNAGKAGATGSRASAPLIDHVEQLVVRYGIAPGWDAADRSTWRPAYYVAAGSVDPADWASKVVAVRLCILMRSSEEVLTGEDSRAYIDCDRAAQTSRDRHLRRTFVSTVALRNKVN